MALVATISTMFDLELIDPDDADTEEHDDFVRFETMRIRTDHLIILIEDQGSMLVAAYNNDPVLRRIIDEHDNSTTFDDAWDVASHQWLRLRAFCGGLATIVPNTTSVESDFSILKWEMDPNRTDLMHLSLEGIFQAK
ncbi:hypothetical protein DYB31_011372 [Aphanomyces astaci]|uniref:Uncharacterized protein n=1 Tax=Aphanomyces astaci TaxID=112090 RepID=A0A397FL93_APHAT|nr:hypothetical protein DYB31_011372 [Aphanomyces astaci]